MGDGPLVGHVMQPCPSSPRADLHPTLTTKRIETTFTAYEQNTHIGGQNVLVGIFTDIPNTRSLCPPPRPTAVVTRVIQQTDTHLGMLGVNALELLADLLQTH